MKKLFTMIGLILCMILSSVSVATAKDGALDGIYLAETSAVIQGLVFDKQEDTLMILLSDMEKIDDKTAQSDLLTTSLAPYYSDKPQIAHNADPSKPADKSKTTVEYMKDEALKIGDWHYKGAYLKVTAPEYTLKEDGSFTLKIGKDTLIRGHYDQEKDQIETEGKDKVTYQRAKE